MLGVLMDGHHVAAGQVDGDDAGGQGLVGAGGDGGHLGNGAALVHGVHAHDTADGLSAGGIVVAAAAAGVVLNLIALAVGGVLHAVSHVDGGGSAAVQDDAVGVNLSLADGAAVVHTDGSAGVQGADGAGVLHVGGAVGLQRGDGTGVRDVGVGVDLHGLHLHAGGHIDGSGGVDADGLHGGAVLQGHGGGAVHLHGVSGDAVELHGTGSAAGGHNHTGGLTGDLHLTVGCHNDEALLVIHAVLAGLVDVHGDGLVQQGHGGGPVDIDAGLDAAVAAAGDDAHLSQRRHVAGSPVGHGRAVGKAAQVGVLHGRDAHSAAEHDHGLLTADHSHGIGVDAVTLHDAGSSALENGVGIPLVAPQVGVGIGSLLGQAKHIDKNLGQLSAGDGGSGVEVAVLIAVYHACGAPPVNGLTGPAAGGIRELRRRSIRCHSRERQHGHHHRT